MPAVSRRASPPREPLHARFSSPILWALNTVRGLLFDRRYYFHLVSLLMAGETLLGLLIIHRVPCELALLKKSREAGAQARRTW
jgi:hypothetical protein